MKVLLFARANLDVSIEARLSDIALEKHNNTMLYLRLDCIAPNLCVDVTVLTKPQHISATEFTNLYCNVFLTDVSDIKRGLARHPTPTASPLLVINNDGLRLCIRSFNTFYVTEENGALHSIFFPEHGVIVAFSDEEKQKFASKFQQFVALCEHGWEHESAQEAPDVFLFSPRIKSD